MSLPAEDLLNRRMTVEEYLAFDAQSPERYEYEYGELVAMAGGTLAHAERSVTFASELRAALRPRGCRVFGSDLKVAVDPKGVYYYPDVTVVCGTPELYQGKKDLLTNPTLIVEVLSPSTEVRDRMLKFRRYSQLPSLQHYLLALPEGAEGDGQGLVQHFVRQEGGWTARFLDLDGSLELQGVSIPLRQLYPDIART